MRSNGRRALENASGEEVLPPCTIHAFQERLNEGLPPAVQPAARDARASASRQPRRDPTPGLSPEVSAAGIRSSSKTRAKTSVSKNHRAALARVALGCMHRHWRAACLYLRRFGYQARGGGEENQQEAVGV